MSPATALVLGNVAQGTVATTFTVDSSGTVTRSPDSASAATRVLVTAAPTPTITINCPNPTAQCGNRPIQVRIAATTSSARLTLLQWLPGSFTYLGGGGSMTVAPSGTTDVTFTVQLNSSSSSMTFKLGHSMTVSASGTTGNADLGYRVTRDYYTASGSGATGTLRTTLFRGLSINKDRDLVFGKMFAPSTGSGTVVIDASTGARTKTGDVILVNDNTTGRAQFTTSGEGTQSVTVSVPGSITMTRTIGGGTLSFTPSVNGGGAAALNGSAGGIGTRVTGVGGTITVQSTTSPGIYEGTITVTASYN